MVSITTYIFRKNLIESKHKAIFLVKDKLYRDILSTKNKDSLIYPRSAIKIFQALPFINSNAHNLFNLSNDSIAMACSSHAGEPQHLKILNEWLKKTGVSINQLQCGIHNPLDETSSNNLLLSGITPSQLHNNCAGKHLGMISGCIANNMEIDHYLDYGHPYQKLIRASLESFTESKIKSNCIGVDGCSAPQYAFPLTNIATSMINLIKEKEKDKNSKYSQAINIITYSIKKYPILIGGHNRFDSDIIRITKGRIFCKGGAEGVLLFADFSKKIGGVIKILDGNNRAIPSVALKIFSKLKMISNNEKKYLKKWSIEILFNHNKKTIGKIISKLK